MHKETEAENNLNNLPQITQVTTAAEDALGRAQLISFLGQCLPPFDEPFPESWQKWLVMPNTYSILLRAKHCDYALSHLIPTMPYSGYHDFTPFIHKEAEV